ncbi:CDP-glucose 4,6-dehydratase [Paraglaciecola arctica]|uniref:CDP-glucose 4,6-dehydratase n=1 Tax=Paraglaciecola arctica TaxID=1128911 RepID=UPI001C0733F0|nr:CDP-glucose 4,6-dehydratase [Paraglaciecola arctica]MBU3002089.1 CDP-glucose 4,6-dehydratase [Paraglaciecola arctica]
MSNSFWSGKKVLITGHTGFKGGWLSLWLQQLGAEVTGFSLAPPTNPNLFEVANVAKEMHSIIGNVCDGQLVLKSIRQTKPEIIIHMAAQSLVRKSYIDPVETYATNVMGTVNVLEAVRQCSFVRAVVNVTSDKCYENNGTTKAFVESDPMGGYDPYSNSKGCAELVAAAYFNSFFNQNENELHRVALASARAGNVIGGGDWALDRLLPDIFKALHKQEAVTIRNPSAIRPWQHVLEPLSGYLSLAKSLYLNGAESAGGWNFGPESEDAKPVRWVVEQICQLWGEDATWQLDKGNHPHEADYLKLNSHKAIKLLNWQPQWQLSESLEQTVSWLKAYHSGQNMRDFTLGQITRFRKL